MKRDNAWPTYNDQDLEHLTHLTDDYINFISSNKTERECTTAAIKLAQAAGYKDLAAMRQAGKTLKPGDKVWATSHHKTVILAHIGNDSLEKGFNILGAHIDSPRLDVKQNPLYEANDLALLDTHYYGGIKQYQWVTLPLALHGVIARTDGSTQSVCIGESDTDPAFCVTDLLPHLGRNQMEKKGSKVVEGEDLDLLVGGRPIKLDDDAEDTPVRTALLKLLADTYHIDENDFLSAELEIVPAGRARHCGFDRSMVLGYGQDDRVCAYTSLIAQLDAATSARTNICILADKEEIGSVGASGLTSKFFENTIAEIMDLICELGKLPLRRALAASDMLSSDVSAAFDPTFASVYDAKNSAFCGCGLVFNKYTGARGKSGSNDADAEYLARIRRIMDDDHVAFQTAELGKVDQGGGGTIAYILAKYGMNVVDCGVAVLSMHAPWEVTNKADIFEAYKGYAAFLKHTVSE